ncbi:MAG TPA: DUF3293 domain-containing protein [Steroidobacteraceae bacterium]|nr:DUF3293 domain-containing protein [Steroidobacteraceae bacterium]
MKRLADAYLCTTYRVWAPGGELQLRVGSENRELAKLLREAWVQGAALLTAWNPGSRPCSRDANESAQQRLLGELAQAGHPCLRARNEPDAPGGPGEDWTEESVLALDLTLPAARALALRYGQVAFLWIDTHATPQLEMAAAGR